MPETATADCFPLLGVIFALRFTKTTAPKERDEHYERTTI